MLTPLFNDFEPMVTRQETNGQPVNEALSRLREAGISIPEWSKANGFKAATVKAVLYGFTKGLRGESHRVAVALGVKDGVVVRAEGFKPVRRTKVQLRAIAGNKK